MRLTYVYSLHLFFLCKKNDYFMSKRSGVLKEQYEACRAEVNRADEEAQFSYQKKKGVAAERKEAKFEKEEAEKYTRLKEELVSYGQ